MRQKGSLHGSCDGLLSCIYQSLVRRAVGGDGGGGAVCGNVCVSYASVRMGTRRALQFNTSHTMATWIAHPRTSNIPPR